MSGFAPSWLALREPFDRSARDEAAPTLGLPAFAARLRARRGHGAPLQVLDLGCGAGANLRALAPALGGTQHWRLVDHDPRLLATLPDALRNWAAAQGWRAVDTAQGLAIDGQQGLALAIAWQQADLAQDAQGLRLAGVDLVTASAWLDLVSAQWLGRWVEVCRMAGAALCWSLSVDDRLQWQPPDAADAEVHALFRAHQRRDKGFGPALGGAAVEAALEALRGAGYRCATAASDWRIVAKAGAAHRDMLAAMIDGIAAAACEQAPPAADAVQAWRGRRHASLLHRPSALGLVVGHTELLGWLD